MYTNNITLVLETVKLIMTNDANHANQDEIARAISVPRLGRYLALVGRASREEALELYVLNARLSGVFMFPLQVFEVSLRNAVDRHITAEYGHDWLTNGSIQMTNIHLKEIRKKIEEKARDQAGPVMVSDFNLGFWLNYFGVHYEDLWRTSTNRIFLTRPKPFTRKYVYFCLDEIREFRNRIAHFEQILSYDPMGHLAKLGEVLSWIEPACEEWLKTHEQVTVTWQEIARLKAERHWSGF